MQPDQGVYEIRGKMEGYKEDEEFVTNHYYEMNLFSPNMPSTLRQKRAVSKF